jgi:hypothetical protein
LAALLALGACAPGPEAADRTIPSPTAPGEPSPTPTIHDIMELEPFPPLEPGTYFIDPDLDPTPRGVRGSLRGMVDVDRRDQVLG